MGRRPGEPTPTPARTIAVSVTTDRHPVRTTLPAAMLSPGGPAFTAAAVAGAALVEASAAIHLHLWAAGYRDIATIGPLFLAQGIVGVALGLAVVALRRYVLVAAGAAYMVASIVGFLLADTVGLFGFVDSFVAPYAGMAFALEVAGAVVMAAAVVARAPSVLRAARG